MDKGRVTPTAVLRLEDFQSYFSPMLYIPVLATNSTIAILITLINVEAGFKHPWSQAILCLMFDTVTLVREEFFPVLLSCILKTATIKICASLRIVAIAANHYLFCCSFNILAEYTFLKKAETGGRGSVVNLVDDSNNRPGETL